MNGAQTSLNGTAASFAVRHKSLVSICSSSTGPKYKSPLKQISFSSACLFFFPGGNCHNIPHKPVAFY